MISAGEGFGPRVVGPLHDSVSSAPGSLEIAQFLDDASSRPAGLIIEGEAGIGKTTLWAKACEHALAHGFRVLSAHGDPSEVSLIFSGAADLLANVDAAVIDQLPPVQRGALNRMLLRDSDFQATDERAAAAAFQSVIQQLAADTPVLIAIDDVQWLDSSSVRLVRFAARRLVGAVGVMVTAREGEPESFDVAPMLPLARPGAVTRLRVPPLTLGDVNALISRLGRKLPRSVLVRIFDTSGGNPLFAIELARAAEDGRETDAQLPPTLAAIVRSRLQEVDPATSILLLAVACASRPTVSLVAAATDTTEHQVVDLLESGDAATIVVIRGNHLRFSHPLLATGVYANAAAKHRREMHRRLAELSDEPELKARHLALSTPSGDETTIQALDTAAKIARRRGAPAAAAELIEMAINRGGDDPIRRMRAAELHLRAGDTDVALTVLAPAIDQLSDGPLKSLAQSIQATTEFFTDSFGLAAQTLASALMVEDLDINFRVAAQALMAFAELMDGQYAAALRHASSAVEDGESTDPTARSSALAVHALVQLYCGRRVDEAALQTARDLEAEDSRVPIPCRASTVTALIRGWTGDLDGGIAGFTEIAHSLRRRGADTELIYVLIYLTVFNIWLGRYDDASRHAAECYEYANQIGRAPMRVFGLSMRGAVAAFIGDIARAEEDLSGALALAQRAVSPLAADLPASIAAFLAISRGDYDQTLTLLEPCLSRFDPSFGLELPAPDYLANAAEAMISLNQLAAAEPLIVALETNGHNLIRPQLSALGARCRAMLLAAQGNVTTALEAARTALTFHDQSPVPLERARTQLLLGQLQRRARQKHSAAATFGDVVSTCEQLGAQLWAQRARDELARLAGPTTQGLGLTATEERVASRAAAGLSNKEIAAELFLAPKTVEMNLSNVYRKLGIRSRGQLHSRLNG